MKVKKLYFSIVTLLVVILITKTAQCKQAVQTGEVLKVLEPNKYSLTITDFDKYLENIADKRHVSFVVEGSPFCATGVTNKIADSNISVSTDELVAKIANSFDYDVTRDGNVFLLSKKYSYPLDLPDVTAGECLHSLQEICLFSRPYNPRLDDPYKEYKAGERDPIMGDLAASLSPIQITALENNSLKVSTLSPNQKALVRRLALYLYVENNMDYAEECLSRLEMPESDSIMCYEDVGAIKHLFGVEMPDGPDHTRYFCPLSGPYATTGNFDSTIEYRNPPSIDDPTTPVAEKIETDPDTITIGVFINGLNAQNKNPKFEVDTALKDKHIIIFGASNTTANALLKAISDLYELDIQDTTVGSLKICKLTLKYVSKPKDELSLRDAVYSALPRPVRKKLHIDQMRNLYAEAVATVGPKLERPQTLANRNDNPHEESLEELREAMDVQHKIRAVLPTIKDLEAQRVKLDQANNNVRIAAIAQLRSLVEPELQTATGGSLNLSELSLPAKNAYSILLMSDFLKSSYVFLSYPVPPMLSRFNEVILTGGIHTDKFGKKYIAIFLSTPTSDGKRLDQGQGMAMVPYIK